MGNLPYRQSDGSNATKVANPKGPKTYDPLTPDELHEIRSRVKGKRQDERTDYGQSTRYAMALGYADHALGVIAEPVESWRVKPGRSALWYAVRTAMRTAETLRLLELDPDEFEAERGTWPEADR